MRLVKLALKGIRGRRRDTLTLGCVLVLAFLFFTASSIVFSSVRATSQKQRLALYGSWQAMVYGADKEQAEALLSKPGANGSEMVGTGNDRLISTIDSGFLNAAGFQITAGALPEGEDDIVLVDGQLGEIGQYKPGDTIKVSYNFDYMQGLPAKYAGDSPVSVWEIIDNAAERLVSEEPEEVEAFFSYRRHYFSHLTVPLSEMSPDEYRETMLATAYSMLNYSNTRRTDNLMLDFEDTVMTVQIFTSQFFFNGGFGEYSGTSLDYAPSVNKVILYKTYTVSGIIAPYAQYWDVRGLSMPGAFVSKDGLAQIKRAMANAEQEYPSAAGYPVEKITLFESAEDEGYIESLIAAYNETLKPSYNTELLNVEDSGDISGYIVGWDEQTGAERYISVYGYNGIANLYDEKSGKTSSVDVLPLKRGEVTIDWLERIPVENLTLDELLKSNTRDFRLNSFAYLAKEDVGGSVQTLLSGALVGITACAAFQIFWVQLRRRRGYLTTLMAVGARDSQAAALLFIEVLMLLVVCSVIGVGLGFGLSAVIVGPVLNGEFSVDINYLAKGAAVCAAAVLIGESVPIFFAVRAPLTANGSAYMGKRTRAKRAKSAGGASAPQYLSENTADGAPGSTKSGPTSKNLSKNSSATRAKTVFKHDAKRAADKRPKKTIYRANSGYYTAHSAPKAADLFEQRREVSSIEQNANQDISRQALTKASLKERASGAEPRAKTKRRGGYGAIAARSLTANRGRTVQQFLMASLLCCVIVLTLFLCSNAFSDYRETALRTDMPDYTFKAPYVMSKAYLKGTAEDIAEMGVGSAQLSAYVTAENVVLHVDAPLSTSPIITAALDADKTGGMFTETPDGGRGLYIRVFGADEGSVLLGKLAQLVPSGAVDPEKLKSGEECILLVPLYRAEGGTVWAKYIDDEALHAISPDLRAGSVLDLSFDKSLSGVYAEDDTIKPGDYITISGYSQKLDDSGTSIVESNDTVKTLVAAVVHCLPDSGVWPLSENGAAYSVVSGSTLVYTIYPQAGTRMNPAASASFSKAAELFYPDCFGKTYIHVTNPLGGNAIELDNQAAAFAESYGVEYENLRISKSRIFSNAMKDMLMMVLLGLEITLVLFTILSATASSAADADRRRYGILSAIGSEDRDIRSAAVGHAAHIACAASAVAVAVLLAIMAAAAAVSSMLSGGGMTQFWVLLVMGFRQYPWLVHSALSALFILVYSAVQSRPVALVIKNPPIDNIRS